jgi:hypothetical protein
MASPKHSTKYTWSNSGDSITRTATLTGDAEANLDPVVNTGVADQNVAFTLDQSKALSIFLVSDRDVTIKTNSSTSPTDTLTLTAGVPKVWTINDGLGECPFTADVTGLYISNSSGAQANINLRVLYDL